MQNVSFKNIEDFLEFIPEDELKMVELLRKIIGDCIPNITEKLSYNVPYYKLNKNICFIWPSSVMWGKKKTYKGVRFGFTNGYLLSDEISFLDKGDRKQVYWKDFENLNEIDVVLLKSYIFGAVEIDKQLSKNKNGIQRKTGR